MFCEKHNLHSNTKQYTLINSKTVETIPCTVKNTCMCNESIKTCTSVISNSEK